jgi:hypothetical protein
MQPSGTLLWLRCFAQPVAVQHSSPHAAVVARCCCTAHRMLQCTEEHTASSHLPQLHPAFLMLRCAPPGASATSFSTSPPTTWAGAASSPPPTRSSGCSYARALHRPSHRQTSGAVPAGAGWQYRGIGGFKSGYRGVDSRVSSTGFHGFRDVSSRARGAGLLAGQHQVRCLAQ